MQELADVDWFSSTTDLWSSVGMVPFISLTVNFQSRMLETHYMPEQHTAANICDVIENNLKLWNLQKQNMVSLTTDNGSNVKLAATLLNIPRIPCFGHILHNAIHYSIDSLDSSAARSITAAKRLHTAFAHSFKRKQELADQQRVLGLPVKAFPGECKTRWGSLYKLINFVLENEKAIRVVLNDRTTMSLMLTASQLKVCHTIIVTVTQFVSCMFLL